MKINLIFNKFIPDYRKASEKIEQSLLAYNIEFRTFDLEKMEYFGDITFVIGGDGTLLRAARFYAKEKVPVLGINVRRLGFLAQAGVDDINGVIEAVMEGRYITENRIMLQSGEYIALNDFVVKGCNPSRTSKFFLEINGKFVSDYIADGLIISTPTGSTAYGLSAGGPVLHPELDAIVIVPICPHTLNARPLVVPSNEHITVKTNDDLLSVSIDGFVTTKCVEKTSIHIAPDKAKLAFLKNNNFYSVLRNKLHWGVSPEG
jgi:NAD+ kinase